MKTTTPLCLLLFLLLSACSSLEKDLQNAIAFGPVTELNTLSPKIDKQLILRFFQAPQHIDGCFTETHGTCKYTYFLSVSTFDEYPETGIFKLQTTGEIAETRWLTSELVDTAKLELVFNRFTSTALKNNSGLINKQRTITVNINPTGITETESLAP